MLSRTREIEWNDLPYGDELGIVDANSLRGHFNKHGPGLHLKSEQEYLELARTTLCDALVSSDSRISLRLSNGVAWEGTVRYKGLLIVVKRARLITCYKSN